MQGRRECGGPEEVGILEAELSNRFGPMQQRTGHAFAGYRGTMSAADTFGRGMLLLGAYSAGLAVPFLLAAWAVDRFLAWFQKFRPYLPWVMRVSGLLLIVVGVLLVTGQFTRLAGFLQGLTPAGLLERL